MSTEVLNQPYELNRVSKTVHFEGKSVPILNYKEGFIASIDNLAAILSDAEYPAQLTKDDDGSVYLLALPKEVIQLTPSVLQTGEH